jgi:hypothetical protein
MNYDLPNHTRCIKQFLAITWDSEEATKEGNCLPPLECVSRNCIHLTVYHSTAFLQGDSQTPYTDPYGSSACAREIWV